MYEDIIARLVRIEDKMDARLTRVETDVKYIGSRLDRMEGGLGLVKWLGPAGVGAVLLGLISLAVR